MDPFTHALSGALLVRATVAAPAAHLQPEQPEIPLRTQMLAGFAAAAFPDIDLVLRLIDTLTYLNWHQGPTHSLVLLPLWAWLLAWFFSWLTGKRYGWRSFYRPACLGIAIHIAGDVITSYGSMLLAPLSTARFSMPLVFVIDPWFTLIIITGLLASWRFKQQRTAAILALIGLWGYVGFLWILQHQIIALAYNYIQLNNLPITQISVLPQPLSPYHWKIIIHHDENYYLTDVDLQKSKSESPSGVNLLSNIAAAYRPSSENHWRIRHQFGDEAMDKSLICEAWLSSAFAPFRTFAQFPVLDRMNVSDYGLCIWFYDLRFQFPELPPSFRYGACRQTSASEWEIVRERGLFYID